MGLMPFINGLVTGGFYALVGAGLSLIWGTLRMVNIAQGELYMLGAYFLYMLVSILGVNPWLSILISIAAMLPLCIVIQLLLVRPLMNKPNWERAPFVITMGLSIFLQNAALLIWGERFKSVPYLSSKMIRFHGISISVQRLIILVVAFVVIMLLMWFIKKHRIGWAIRATAQNKQAATLVGIDTPNIFLFTFAVAGALAAVAGCLLAPIYGINPWMGAQVQMKGLVVCVLGGLGSLEGSIIAGFLLGTIESLTVEFIASEWKDVCAYLMLIVILWVRPSGLFGKRERR